MHRAVKFLFSFRRIILSTILYHHYYSLLSARWSRASVSTGHKDKQTRWFIGKVVEVAGGGADRLDNNATVTVDFIPCRVFIFCYQIIYCLVIDLHPMAPCQRDASKMSPWSIDIHANALAISGYIGLTARSQHRATGEGSLVLVCISPLLNNVRGRKREKRNDRLCIDCVFSKCYNPDIDRLICLWIGNDWQMAKYREHIIEANIFFTKPNEKGR